MIKSCMRNINKKLVNRILVAVMAVVILVGFIGCSGIKDSESAEEISDELQVIDSLSDTDEDARFEAFLDEEYLHLMEQDCLERNLGTVDYAGFGITDPDNTLQARDEDYLEQLLREEEQSLAALEEFDPELLNEQNRVSYENYHFFLTNDMVLNQYPLFHEQYNPYTGEFADIVIALMEYKFRREKDFGDYLEILASLPDCMDDMMDMTERQAQEGYFMTWDALEKQVADMREVVRQGEEWALVAYFDKNVDGFLGLSVETADGYKASCREVVKQHILPAYARVADRLEALQGSRQLDVGIAAYEGGEAYYTALSHLAASSNQSIEGLLAKARYAYDDCLEYMAWIWANDGLQGITQAEFEDVARMMEYAEGHMDCFPDTIDVPYSIFYLDSAFTNSSIAAYYLVPPVDDLTENVIKVNPNTLERYSENDLFFAIAHEGIPGHMYQMIYAYNHGMPALTPCLGLLGYEEGWAQYGAARMTMELPIDKESCEASMVETVWDYLAMSLMDLMINGKGFTYEELLEEMGDLGLSEAFLSEENYRYFIDTRGMALPYGMGEIAFLIERDKVVCALGDGFDEVEFHEVLLQNGIRLFDTVREDVNNYLLEKKANIPQDYGLFHAEIAHYQLSQK